MGYTLPDDLICCFVALLSKMQEFFSSLGSGSDYLIYTNYFSMVANLTSFLFFSNIFVDYC